MINKRQNHADHVIPKRLFKHTRKFNIGPENLEISFFFLIQRLGLCCWFYVNAVMCEEPNTDDYKSDYVNKMLIKFKQSDLP